MLRQAEHGILYRPPQNVIDDNPDIRFVNSYSQLKNLVSGILDEESIIIFRYSVVRD